MAAQPQRRLPTPFVDGSSFSAPSVGEDVVVHRVVAVVLAVAEVVQPAVSVDAVDHRAVVAVDRLAAAEEDGD